MHGAAPAYPRAPQVPKAAKGAKIANTRERHHGHVQWTILELPSWRIPLWHDRVFRNCLEHTQQRGVPSSRQLIDAQAAHLIVDAGNKRCLAF
jgi:hypothetical protein